MPQTLLGLGNGGPRGRVIAAQCDTSATRRKELGMPRPERGYTASAGNDESA
jgi:hypothetical protein